METFIFSRRKLLRRDRGAFKKARMYEVKLETNLRYLFIARARARATDGEIIRHEGRVERKRALTIGFLIDDR